MSILLYAAGLIIGLTVFLWLLSAYESGKEKMRQMMQKPAPGPGPGARQEAATEMRNEEVEFAQPQRRPPGKRICPLCSTPLQKYEALYAGHVESPSGNKILIFGCRYCYRPDEDPDEEKRSDYR